MQGRLTASDPSSSDEKMSFPTRTLALAAAALAAAIALAAFGAAPERAKAAYGDDFGIAEAKGAAFGDRDQALFAGTCDTTSTSTSNGGVGTVTPSPHCLDLGVAYGGCFEDCPPGGEPNLGRVWDPAQRPAWRRDPATQAGGHPDLTIGFWLTRSLVEQQQDGEMKTVEVSLPPGLSANPTAVPPCESEKLTTYPVRCEPESQVGVLTAGVMEVNNESPARREIYQRTYPVYLAEPRDGKAAELIVSAQLQATTGANVPIVASVRTDENYEIDSIATNLPAGAPVVNQTITLWGTPWDQAHDIYRPVAEFSGSGDSTDGLLGTGIQLSGLPGGIGSGGLSMEPQPHDPSWGEIRPFVTNASECSGDPLEAGVRLDSYQNPGEFVSYTTPFDAPISGCERVPFDPAIAVTPTNATADSPTGLEVELTIPQNNDPPFDLRFDPDSEEGAPAHWRSDAGLASSHLEDAVVTLPEGMSVNPAGANGQKACSPGQIGLKSKSPIRFDNSDPDDGQGADCPNGSKIGTVRIETPLLEQEDWPEGVVYLAEQGDKGPAQGSNPFDSLLAIYIVAESPKRGLIIKLAGEVKPNPDTGQLETTFLNNPPLPFERFSLRFKGGPRAPLATPPSCGTHTTTASLTPYSSPDDPVELTDSFEITSAPGGQPCPSLLTERPFDLDLSAGVLDAQAGGSSPFVLRLTRPDGHQEVAQMSVATPEGVSGMLRGIPRCSDAAANSGTCPEASRVGSSIVGAGAGPSPYYVDQGKVYLAGPYKGAPLSLAIQVPAVAGPFDLGIVNVRAALHVNPRTAELTVVSDPIPQIIEGIPLRNRDIRIRIDRPGFMTSPTDCSAGRRIRANVVGSHGATAQLAEPFRVGNCAALDFGPELDFRIDGKRANRRNNHPQLDATLTVEHPPNAFNPAASPDVLPEANIDRVAVTLPPSLFLDQDSLSTICTRPQFAAEQCPPNTRIGFAEAHSPLIDEPLTGPVYLIASDNQLPDMVADLAGIIDIDLFGRIDQNRRRIRNTFDVVPDVAVSRFDLTIDGGRKGLLVNSEDLCRKPSYRQSEALIFGQNGRTAHQRPVLEIPACEAQHARAERLRDRADKLAKKATKLKRKAKRAQRKARKANGKKATKKLKRKAKRAKRKAKRAKRKSRKLSKRAERLGS